MPKSMACMRATSRAARLRLGPRRSRTEGNLPRFPSVTSLPPLKTSQRGEGLVEHRFGARKTFGPVLDPRELRRDAIAFGGQHAVYFGGLRPAEAFAPEHHVFGADRLGEVRFAQ